MKNILIDPKTGEEYIDVPPSIAAKYLDVTVLLVREGIKSGALPIGVAVQPTPGGKWIFNIPIARLKAYREATDLSLKSAIAELITLMPKAKGGSYGLHNNQPRSECSQSN